MNIPGYSDVQVNLLSDPAGFIATQERLLQKVRVNTASSNFDSTGVTPKAAKSAAGSKRQVCSNMI
jgi:hypothetical protein